MAPIRSAFCSEGSSEIGESLTATASRVDNWIVVEYRGLWSHDAFAGSGLSDEVKQHLRAQAAAPRTKLLFARGARGDVRASGLSVFWGRSTEDGGTFSHAELETYDGLLELDFSAAGEPLEHPLLLVCTHGKHDRCCARYGRPLYEALRQQVDERWVWQSTHVGGDRFAGNLVCLPEGLYFGRVGPDDAWPLLDEYLGGRIYLARYRGRSCYSFAAQAAESALREELRLTGVGDLALVDVEHHGTASTVRFRVVGSGAKYAVEVSEKQGDLTYLTCKAATLRHPRRFVAGTPRESAV